MNLRTPLAVAGTTLLVLTLASCAHTGDASASASTDAASDRGMGSGSSISSAGGGGARTGASVPVAGSEPEAVALVALVDQHEVSLARQARSKNVTGPVLEYANVMDTHHTQHLTQTRALQQQAGSAPTASAGVQQLMAMDQQTQARLGALEGDAYARAYMAHMAHMAHMVESHRMGIAMVDAAMPKVRDATLRAFMTATRQSMQMHLDRALELQRPTGG